MFKIKAKVSGVVKGIYVSWSNDPPNTKIKDWNVTELKACALYPDLSFINLFIVSID